MYFLLVLHSINAKVCKARWLDEIYTNIIKLKSLFVCLNALISGTTGSNSKNLFALDSPFIEEGYRLYTIMLRPIGAEQRVKPRGTASYGILLYLFWEG